MKRLTALAAIFSAAVGLAGCGKSDNPQVDIVAAQADAVATLKQLGADITPAEPSADEPVTQVALNGDKVADDAMPHVARLGKLKTLLLKNSTVTPAGLAQIGPLVTLTTLDLSGSKKINDDAIGKIAHLAGLQVLILNDTAVTDAGLQWVGRLSGLHRLELANTAVGDAGLKKLKPLILLEDLNLEGTKVTDAGMDALTALPALQSVGLINTAVTIDGADKLKDPKDGKPNLKVIR